MSQIYIYIYLSKIWNISIFYGPDSGKWCCLFSRCVLMPPSSLHKMTRKICPSRYVRATANRPTALVRELESPSFNDRLGRSVLHVMGMWEESETTLSLHIPIEMLDEIEMLK